MTYVFQSEHDRAQRNHDGSHDADEPGVMNIRLKAVDKLSKHTEQLKVSQMNQLQQTSQNS
jgi:hypothetical protein